MLLNVLSHSRGNILFYRNLYFVFGASEFVLIYKLLKWKVKLKKKEHFPPSFGFWPLSMTAKTARDICAVYAVYREVAMAETTFVIGIPSSEMEILFSKMHLGLAVQLCSMNCD